MLSGGPIKNILAISFTGLVFLYKFRKEKYNIVDILDLSWILFTGSFFIYNLFIMDYGKMTLSFFGKSLENSDTLYHPINWYMAFWIGLLLSIRFIIRFKSFWFSYHFNL